jgi:hypothetical protein
LVVAVLLENGAGRRVDLNGRRGARRKSIRR